MLFHSLEHQVAFRAKFSYYRRIVFARIRTVSNAYSLEYDTIKEIVILIKY